MKKPNLFVAVLILIFIVVAISLASFVPTVITEINAENAYHQSHETTGDR